MGSVADSPSPLTRDVTALPRPAAVVFDLDGTLVDTVPARIRGWRDVLDAEGLRLTDADLAPMIGIDGRRLAREAATIAGRTLDAAEQERIDHEAGERFDVHNADPRPLPGVHDALARLDGAGIAWAIATSSRAEQVGASVAALRLPRAPRIVDGSRVAHAKPAPDLLLRASDELGVDPARVWYVGDATWDMRAAVAAGMVPIAVVAGSAVDEAALREAGAAVVLASLADLQISG
jgi:HAD superfamily hydrolase (TIGR01509 family)